MLWSGTSKGELSPPSSANTLSFTGECPNTVLCFPQPVTTWICSGKSLICAGTPFCPFATPAVFSRIARVPRPAAAASSGASARARMRRSHQRSTVCAVPALRMRCRSSTPSSSSHRKWPSSCACSSHAVARSHCPVSSATSISASKVMASGAMPSSCMRAMASPARCHCRRASCDAISELYVCTVRRAPQSVICAKALSTSSPRPLTCSARKSASYACVSAAPGRDTAGAPGYVPRRAAALDAPRVASSARARASSPGFEPRRSVSSATTSRRRSHRSPRSVETADACEPCPLGSATASTASPSSSPEISPADPNAMARRAAASASARASAAACSFSMPHRQSSVMASGVCPDLNSSRNTVDTSPQSRSADAPMSMVLYVTSVG
mmetsp:Transcript_10005/g.42537  ORF Transcript_10005/g.42537 Transcript_10005/m.42537 type:complete len:385 (+) Transcript_10005:296-1450(+)